MSDLDFDFKSLLDFIPARGTFILKTSDSNYVTVNQANIRSILSNLNSWTMNEILNFGEDSMGSDFVFVQSIIGNGILTVYTPNSRQFQNTNLAPRGAYNRRRGQWFPYAHTIHNLDLREYQIFHCDDMQTDEKQCLIYALQESSSCPSSFVTYLQTVVARKAQCVSIASLKNICLMHDTELQVIALKRRQKGGEVYTKQNIFYPSRNSKCKHKVKVCLFANHYFIYKANTGVYKWALQNPEEAKRIQLKKFPDKHWAKVTDKSNRKPLDSYNLVKFLVESMAETNYLQEINRSQQSARIRNYLKLQHEYHNLDLSDEDAAPYGVRPMVDETVAEAIDRVNLNKQKQESGESRPKPKKMLFAFDFETTTNGSHHVPYLACAQRIMPPQFDVPLEDLELESEKYPIYTFYGRHCGQKMLKKLSEIWAAEKSDYRGGIQLIAHNAGYDIRFIFEYFSQYFTPKLTRGSLGRLKALTALYVYDQQKFNANLGKAKIINNKKKRKAEAENGVPSNLQGIKYGHKSDSNVIITVHDSLNFTMCPLSNFPRMFNLGPIVKEIMPYDAYTQELFTSDPSDPMYALKPLEELKAMLSAKLSENPQHVYARKHNIQGCLSSDVSKASSEYAEKFEANVVEWGCLRTINNIQYVDLEKYAKWYCERDVDILAKGYCKLRHMFHTVSKGLNIDHCVSVNQLTNKALQDYGCTEGVMELSGVVRDFIQQCVTGGKCMLRNNQKQKVENKVIADFDAVSLYPAAMAEMPGLLKGTPKVIPEGATYQDMEQLIDKGNKGAWFAKIVITAVNKEWQMPICNYYDYTESKRIFTNDIIGKTMWCSSVTAQDLRQMQDVEFTILQGYYFDSGYNTKLKEFITNIFNERLRMKKQKNPMQLVYKLMMNGAYGRLILKPIETDNTFFPSSREFSRYLKQNWQLVKSFEKMPEGGCFSYCVELYKEIYRHWSAPHLGVMVLDHSKRIMNRLHNIAHDINIPIYYMDTDSMHLLNDDIKRMCQEFKVRYPELNNGVLIGKNLGQFHNDFAIKALGPITLPKFDDKDIRSSCFIAYGKKCYLHLLNAPTQDSKHPTVHGHSMAMKGFTENSVYDTCNRHNMTLSTLFNNVYSGQAYKADLLAGGRVSFEYNRQMQVKSRDTMMRTMRCIV